MGKSKLPIYALYALGRVLRGSLRADKRYLDILYRHEMGHGCDFQNPRKFSEKMQWLKLYNRDPIYTRLVDKDAAKEYVREKLGARYLIPTLGRWNRFEDINFDLLPDRFVLKCTHDSGGLIICKDKKTLDLETAKRKIEHCLKRNYYLNYREWPYKGVPRKIIAEEYLENGEEGLHDYKVWCFNGEPVYIQYITGRTGVQVYEGFYDLDWTLQDFFYHNPIMNVPAGKPKRLPEMIDACRTLAKGHPFVRCDFYVLEDESLRFGEMTFFPMSGMERWHPEYMDEILGEMITLPKKR